MTYDFSNPQKPGPNAPIEWVRQSVVSLCPDAEGGRDKILVGLNMYGNMYGKGQGQTIVKGQYLELLEEHEPRLVWD
ncbi:Chitinase domain-containing protein 1, partial [Podochytrium sp. JEL0797]